MKGLTRFCFTWWFRVFVPLLIGLIVRGVLGKIGFHPPGGIVGDLGFFAAYYIFGLLVVNLPSIWFVASVIPDLSKIDLLARPPARSEITTFAKRDVQNLLKRTAGVLGPTGEMMNKADVDEFTKRCFRLGGGIYNGVERHLPSKFFERYPGYLEGHEWNLQKNPKNRSVRILLATRASLREDYQIDREAYERFFHWHESRAPYVELLHVHPRLARQEANDLRLPTTDVAIWKDQYALLFQPEEKGTSAVLSMVPKGSPAFGKCSQYLATLTEAAQAVTNPPQLVDRSIAENWEAYVSPSKRHKRLGPVLLSRLDSYKAADRILDAAAGIGCESVLLKDEGFNVVSNELEENFREVAKRYAHNHSCTLEPFDKYNWTELSSHYRTAFGAILVLGNSLCLVTREKRTVAIEEFFDVLRRGGILIIDERNFDYMARNREHIMENPAQNFPFGRCMYHGTTVRGCPIEINDEKVVWACYKDGASVEDWQGLQKNIIGEFELYPSKEGELKSTLTHCGFEVSATYYNLDDTPVPDAEFITYVARKP